MNATTRLPRIMAAPEKMEHSFSDIPSCRLFATVVMMAAVCPVGSISSVEMGRLKRARKYVVRTAAEIRRLVIRRPSLMGGESTKLDYVKRGGGNKHSTRTSGTA